MKIGRPLSLRSNQWAITSIRKYSIFNFLERVYPLPSVFGPTTDVLLRVPG